MSESVRQWKRKVQVVIGKAGTGLMVENLRIHFEVAKTIESAPNVAVIKIYNLHPDNEAKIKNEFDEVLLNCGYEGAMRLVFRGNIKHVYRYRDKTDYITEIEAGDGDKDFRSAVMNETLAAGTTNAQLVDRAVGSFKGTGGTTKGHVQVNERARIRGKVISGNTRDVIHDVARESGANWSIQDGQLVIVNANDVLPGQAIVIRADTGMLGAPEINDKGIAVKCLINPQLRVNGAIQLDNNGIKAKRVKAQALATKREKQETNAPLGRENEQLVRLDPDGIYKVLKLTHKGDNRGQDWVSEIECIGLDQPIPSTR
jgi:hypothetical protein